MPHHLPDLQEIKALLESGADPAWRDRAGNSLLHHAARTGDADTIRACFAQGLKTLVYNNESESAADIARSWGHEVVAKIIDEQMVREREASPPAPIGYTSLEEIRDCCQKTGKNVFYDLARQGVFDQVIALAEKNVESFSANDLLGKGHDGDTALLAVCQRGQFPLLLKPELWAKSTADFVSIWEKTPHIYQKGFDIGGFMQRLNQLKLRSQAQRNPWQGPR